VGAGVRPNGDDNALRVDPVGQQGRARPLPDPAGEGVGRDFGVRLQPRPEPNGKRVVAIAHRQEHRPRRQVPGVGVGDRDQPSRWRTTGVGAARVGQEGSSVPSSRPPAGVGPPPSASASNWHPRQMPRVGMAGLDAPASRRFSAASQGKASPDSPHAAAQ